MHRTLADSCLLPHHEWFTAAISGKNNLVYFTTNVVDNLASIELVAETRIANELGMSPKLVEPAALKIRRQVIAITKLFRCFDIAINALSQMASSRVITTHGKFRAGALPPYHPSDLTNAVGTVPVKPI